MKSITEKLFYAYANETDCNEPVNATETETEIAINKKRLKKKLNQKQKKLLLRIIDGKDFLNEKSSRESFIAGFKIGLQIGYESK